jgi:uncharacterized repeat protein (TIGR02543 family)
MTKTWHTFGGWYTDSAHTVPAVFPVTVTANVNLYAKWIVNTLTSVADVGSYLASLENNTIDNPASLAVNISLGTMTATDSGWQQLLDAVNTAGRFVNLDLSACIMTGTSFDPDSSVATGKDRIVSLVLPTIATSTEAGSPVDPTFRSFNNLKSISGAYITTIGNSAFYSSISGNTILQNAEFPRVVDIGSYAFYYCKGLQSVNFPQVTTIGLGAFESCTSIQSVSFPLATSIELSAFDNCTALQSASFPAWAELGRLGSTYFNPFRGCTSLTSFTLIGTGSLSVIENGKALVRNGTILLAYPSASGTVTLNTVTAIDDGAFYSCTGLQSVSFPQVTSIGDMAFYRCTGLQSLNIPKATSIGMFAFAYTGTATLSITMGPTAPTLDSEIFSYATSAKTVTVKVPSGATGYSPAPSPFTGSAVTVSGTNTDANWGNGFRGGGWDGTTWDSYLGGPENINQNISLIIEQQ